MTRSPLLGLSLLLAGSFLWPASAGAQTLPVANAGVDQVIPCAPPTGAEVVLDAAASFDPDDPAAVLTFTWSGDEALGVGVTVDGAMPTVLLAPGIHVLTLTVDDGVDGTATDDVQVEVIADTEPPQMALSQTAVELWPPNHKLHALAAADFVASVSDSCDTALSAADVVFSRGTSDEPDDGRGDGNTTGDIVFGDGCATALVRAERAGPGDGRVYELTLQATDAAGNAAEAVITASIPHDQAHAAVDSGDAFEVAGECTPLELCPPEPSDSCDDAGEARVQLRAGGKHGPSLRWRARGFSAADGAFSDPGSDYQLCVYTDDGAQGALVDDPAAPSGSGWKHQKRGAAFRGRKAGPMAGLAKLKLGARKGHGALSLAAGGDVTLPELPLPAGTSLRLQLQSSDGSCLESEFDDPDVNDANRLEDRTPGPGA
jgi:hypothetical protein